MGTKMSQSSSKDQRRLYGDLAWTWPIISPPEGYAKESEQFTKIIREHSKIEVRTLLNLGCGGGHNDHTLKKHFEVTGLDVSRAMINLAKKLNPEVSYLIGDMCTVRLKKAFDAVTIFDSINYMLTEEQLYSAFTTAFVHLRPNGVFLTCQENSPECLKQNQTEYSTHSKGDVTITFIENNYDPDPRDTTYESTFIYLIRCRNELTIETDRHLAGIFPKETWLNLLRETGFSVKVLDMPALQGIPVLVCTRSP